MTNVNVLCEGKFVHFCKWWEFVFSPWCTYLCG